MTNEQLYREALEAIANANLDDCCPPRSLQDVARQALRRAAGEAMTNPRDEWVQGLTQAALTLRNSYPQLAYWVALARDEIKRQSSAEPEKP